MSPDAAVAHPDHAGYIRISCQRPRRSPSQEAHVGVSRRHVAPLPREEEALRDPVRADGAAIELVLRGELDLAGAPRLAGALEAAMAAGYEQIALELAELEFIDGAGVGLIDRTGRQLRRRG